MRGGRERPLTPLSGNCVRSTWTLWLLLKRSLTDATSAGRLRSSVNRYRKLGSKSQLAIDGRRTLFLSNPPKEQFATALLANHGTPTEHELDSDPIRDAAKGGYSISVRVHLQASKHDQPQRPVSRTREHAGESVRASSLVVKNNISLEINFPLQLTATVQSFLGGPPLNFVRCEAPGGQACVMWLEQRLIAC